MLINLDVVSISTFFSKTVRNADIIRPIMRLFNFYRTKLFPLLKYIDSYFMKSIGIYSSENTRYCIVFGSSENHSCQTRS